MVADSALLSIPQMTRADALAIAGGVPGARLMEAAGWAVALEVRRRFRSCRVLVLCGPGNNGGDGYVAARHLERWGYRVRLASLVEPSALKGDAALMAAQWRGGVETLGPDSLDGADVVVDALFGAGLQRPVAGIAAATIEEIGRRRLPVIAVDVPSGVDGGSGAVLGTAPDALATVTFFRRKTGHLLLPGRVKCGEVVVADIGISASVLEYLGPVVHENGPERWLRHFPFPQPQGHKYARGHALVIGGGEMTGAARLAARAARRVGAGLVTIVAPDLALAIYRGGEPGAIVRSLADYSALVADMRHNAVLLGPGAGADEDTRCRARDALAAGKATVLDADAISAFAATPRRLFADITPNTLLTPHDGEFRRLFGDMAGGRLERARKGAEQSGAVVLLKGADTVIAHPDGRAVINANAPPWLATAGAGDVLAGLAVGLMAQGMEAFDAACAAAWLHGEAATRFGPGLIAEDLSEILPSVLAELGRRHNFKVFE